MGTGHAPLKIGATPPFRKGHAPFRTPRLELPYLGTVHAPLEIGAKPPFRTDHAPFRTPRLELPYLGTGHAPLEIGATPPAEPRIWGSCIWGGPHIWEQTTPLSRLEPRPLSEQVTPRETGATPSLEQATPPSEHHVWSCHIWEQATPLEIGATPPFRTARASAKLEPRPLRIGATPPYGTAHAYSKLEPRPLSEQVTPLRFGATPLSNRTRPSKLEPRPLKNRPRLPSNWNHAPCRTPYLGFPYLGTGHAPLKIGATPPFRTDHALSILEPRPFRIGPALRHGSHAPSIWSHAHFRLGRLEPTTPRGLKLRPFPP